MKEIIKMLVVLTTITTVCGFLLAGIRGATKDRIQEQELTYVKGPAVNEVLGECDNDPIKDRVVMDLSCGEVIVFTCKKGDEMKSVAYERSSPGFGGDLGVMMGINLEDHTLTSIGITNHKETPGVGSRVGEASFRDGFKGKALDSEFKVIADGGLIDAVSGATVSSRAVCAAVQDGTGLFDQILAKISN